MADESLAALHDQAQHIRAMWAAVLMRAIEDAAGRSIHAAAASAWFASDAAGPGTFAWVCAVLDLEIEVVRRAAQAPDIRRRLREHQGAPSRRPSTAVVDLFSGSGAA